MTGFARNLIRMLAILTGIPAAGLLAYDLVAVRPHLTQIEQILAQAPPLDAAPPEMIRRLIDANCGAPTPYVVSSVLARLQPSASPATWHMRRALWHLLLPLHLDKSQMYGLFATLTFNGSDTGLSAYARREYGRTLAELTLPQAAATVAMTHAPAFYRDNRSRLEQRARMLLERMAADAKPASRY